MASTKPVLVRPVYQYNLQQEFNLIRSALQFYKYVSIDIEFPGTVFRPRTEKQAKHHYLSPADTYLFMKINVESTKIIQLGLTLSDSQGNLPDFNTSCSYVWEFNFKDFDITKDLYNTESIELLRKQGIDFEKNKRDGVNPDAFASYFVGSGLVCTESRLTWLTFHSACDFGYLLKILTGVKLPRDLNVFVECVRRWFGVRVYDMKQMMSYCQMYGGLERMAKDLEVDRVAGKSHQAGSDSLLIMQTFMKFKDRFFGGDEVNVLNEFAACKLYGFEVMSQFQRLC